jgi:hypothetical protein
MKRSGRDEPIWVVMHKCMEATLGISLYSKLSLFQSSEIVCLSYYLLCFLFNKIGEEEGGKGSAWKWVDGRAGKWGEGGTNNVYTYE